MLSLQVEKLKSCTDIRILSIHWGVDYSYFATKEQQLIAHRLIRNGFNIVAGHHSHTFQTVERIGNDISFYGLGGFTFGDYFKNDRWYSLPLKTKSSYIVNYYLENQSFTMTPILERIRNYLEIKHEIPFPARVKRINILTRLKNNYKVIHLVLVFKEVYFDRIYDYFFGYYNQPVKQLFSVSNYRKIGNFQKKFTTHKKRKL
jgi:hypothetical protein